MLCSQDQTPGASLPWVAPWLDGDAGDAAASALGGVSLLPLELCRGGGRLWREHRERRPQVTKGTSGVEGCQEATR